PRHNYSSPAADGDADAASDPRRGGVGVLALARPLFSTAHDPGVVWGSSGSLWSFLMTGPVSLDAPLGTPTDWSRYDVPSLWAMASMEDSSDSWTQVWAWWRCRDALDAYRRHLTACRDGLADKWPPQRSPASAAFLGRVDEMIKSVGETAEAAASNAVGLAGIINALDD